MYGVSSNSTHRSFDSRASRSMSSPRGGTPTVREEGEGGEGDGVFEDDIVWRKKGPVRQMRAVGQAPAAPHAEGKGPAHGKKNPPGGGQPKSADAFLSQISDSLGVSNLESDWEKPPVGSKHHRKTKSVCSIDWSIGEGGEREVGCARCRRS